MDKLPDPSVIHPVPGFSVTYVKPTITHPNIEVGDFTYYSGENFEAQVMHHYEFYGDKLIIGKFCQIAEGVTFIMNGAIIGLNSVVGSNVEPYTIVAGNPAKPIRKRFHDELIGLLEAFKWWDKPVYEIQTLIPLLSDSNLELVKRELKNRMHGTF